MNKKNIVFIGFENLNLKNSYMWSDYRQRFTLIDFNVIFLNLTNWHYKFKEYNIISKDLYNAIDTGSMVIIIFDLATGKFVDSSGFERQKENLDILPFSYLSRCFTYDNGKSKINIEDRFKRYFRYLDEWKWYFSKDFSEPNWHYCSLTPLAINKIERPIGFMLHLKKSQNSTGGFLIILPKIKNIEIGLKKLLEDSFNIKIFEKAPSWLKDIKTAEEKKLFKTHKNAKNNLKKGCKKLKEINNKLKDEKIIKKILYEDGIELEDSVKSVFKRMKINYYKEKISEEDCFVESKYGNFLFEIKGSESGFTKKGLRQLVDWEQDLEEKKYKIDRCIFIGNHYRLNPILERKYPFENNLLKFAERNDFLILLTQDLFKIYNLYISKNISTVKIYKIFKNSPTIFDFNKLTI